MKIFVGYGYNDRDTWVEDLVFPLILALGDEVVTGKEIFGEKLDDGVRSEIGESDALIGFTTRRDPLAGGNSWTTHEWVRDELLYAANLKPPIPFVEVRETQVDPQFGMLIGRARINYEEKARDRCLVELAQTISRWHHSAASFQVDLMPEDFSNEIRPKLGDSGLRCVYQVLNKKWEEGQEIDTPIRPFPGRLAIRTGAVPRDAMIRVAVYQDRERLWSSRWQPVESRTIHLSREIKK
jgi:hypothetical protein